MQDTTPVGEGAWPALGPPALYLGVSFLFFGLPVVLSPGRPYVGFGPDPEIFIWSFAWWAHALTHGISPLHTDAIWVPGGFNLAFSATAQGVAAVFIPVTLLLGPVASYDVAAVVLPAAAAWTAFLLCRHLTRKTWPSLAGGYLFGFSSYMLGQEQGHLHMTSVFLLPLVALLVLRGLEGTLSSRSLAVRLGAVLGAQIWISTEVFATAALALAIGLAAAALTIPTARRRIRGVMPGIAGACVVGVILGAPLLYLALPDAGSGSLNFPEDFPSDALNTVVPTGLTLLGGHLASSLVHFTAGNAESGGYLGLPAVAILVMFLARRRRTASGRFLFVAFAVALVLSYGASLQVAGHDVAWLPWSALSYLAPFDNILPSRLSVYVSLLAAVVVALWASSEADRRARFAMGACACLALVPMLGHGYWKTTPPRPAFFASPAFERCVPRGASILTLPYNNHGDALLWQAESRFRFGLAEGYVTVKWPSAYVAAGEVFSQLESGRTTPTVGAAAILHFARSKGVAAILVREGTSPGWYRTLAGAIRPVRAGGVAVFPLRPGSRC